MATPKRGVSYDFYAALTSQADPSEFLTDPTIAAGDFQVSTDGGAFANLTTLPTTTPASSGSVLFSLSASEMTGDKVVVRGIDQAGDEWQDILVFIDVPESTSDDLDTLLNEIHLIHGLNSGSPMTVTPTSRAAGSVSQAISGDGETSTTVTRT